MNTRGKRNQEKGSDASAPEDIKPPLRDQTTPQIEYSEFNVLKIIFKVGMSFLVILLYVIVQDAFLIKYNASFTLSGSIMVAVGHMRAAVYDVGYYIAKLANVFQLAWDALEQVLEAIKPYLPMDELYVSKRLAEDAFRTLFTFLTTGWMRSAAEGVFDGIKINAYLPLGMVVLVVLYTNRDKLVELRKAMSITPSK